MWYRVAQLLYLMVPAYVANMAPPFTRFWRGWNPPISQRWLGSHKTALGAVLGVVLGAMAGLGLQTIGWEGSLVPHHQWLLAGLLMGVGAMSGDLLKSYAKRRLGIAPGDRWIPFDQLDFVAGALLFVAPFVRLTWGDVAIVLVVSFGGDVLVNHVAFWVRIRDAKW